METGARVPVCPKGRLNRHKLAGWEKTAPRKIVRVGVNFVG